jgi:signal transduction histidine kinase
VEKVFSRQLKILSETAIELFSGNKENIFEFIGETIHKLISNSVVIVNEYKKDDSLLQTRFVKGMGFSMNLISQLLGKHPLNKKYRVDVNSESYQNVISTYLQEVKGGLAELSFGSISEPVARKIEKISKAKRFYACGLYVRGILYGTIIIMLRSDSQMNNYIIETFARMVSHALHAQQMGKQLSQSRKLLTDAGRIARMGYWQYRFCDNTFIINKDIFNPTPNCNDKGRNISIPLEVFLKKFVDSRDADLIRSKFAEAAQNSNNTSHAFDLEWTFIRENRAPLFVYTRAVVQKGGYILGITQDVSEIKKAEHQLWESESKFKNLVDQSLDSIIIIQDDGKITEWNPQTEKLTLIPSSSVIGKNVWDVELDLIYKPQWQEQPSIELKEKLRRRFFQFFNLNKQSALLNREITIKNNIDEIKELSVTSFVFSANHRKFLCRISKDITLTKREREKQKEKEINQGAAKVKELFLDNMSHEMRTPLSGIIGMTEILMHSGLNGHQQELLNVVKESSDTLLELISNIHELSTIDANKIIIKEREFVFKHLLDKTLTMFKAVSLQKNIKMDLQNTAPDNLVLYGDDFRIQQVLTNLLANAIKFTPAGGEVTLEALTQDIGEDTVRLRLVVKDTGIGIKEEKTSILFEKFTQADSSYTREHEGAGIGLYITRQIVEMMGGTIGVTSKHMKGSNFWVQINLPKRN